MPLPMFLVSRPTQDQIETFLAESQGLELSYGPASIRRQPSPGFTVDEATGVLGYGIRTFESARAALTEWRHFDLGWVELHPHAAPVEVGTVVAVLVRHLGFWSLNGCRIVYLLDDAKNETSFGFAYGTLTNHAEMGEELFEVQFNPESGEVTYRIRAVSKPRAALAVLGYPYSRLCQARFRRESIAAMERAVNSRSITEV
jgi:uncharacterized protein (UPF0548 family)